MTRDQLQTFALIYGLGIPLTVMLWTALPFAVVQAAAFTLLSFLFGIVGYLLTALAYGFGCGLVIGWRSAWRWPRE